MPALTLTQIQHQLNATLSHWTYHKDKNVIQRQFQFANYYETMAFVNAIAYLAHQTNHHPDLEVHYQTCLVAYCTHDAGGITEKDIFCAQKVNELHEKN
ncbi:MAG: 4a-hydroxytetrahydrobiopterin dehydratase [Gammaproteobacteria bacterium]|nr:4a-hydroxytetrahydrobiopterin dehydratase [Gammaproteobacteria bacterium]